MFDGKTFLPVTGIPIRKIACMMRPLADADPVPLAVAILNAKSFTRSMGLLLDLRGSNPSQRWYRYNLSRERDMNHRLAHVPCVGRATFRAQSAVDAHVLVLHHHAAGLLERRGHEQRLSGFRARRRQATLEHRLLVVTDDRQAIGRADVDAGVAFDA